jgi:DNA-binding NarL/FixJ family response regulator
MAAAGHSMLDRDTVAQLIEELASGESDSRLDKLTRQERRVFELIGHGLSNREIGELLHVTEKTAKNYVSRTLTKLDMSRRTEAAILAVRIRERKAWLRMQGRG